jgi:hypothetical protein
MPVPPFPTDKKKLAALGVRQIMRFCRINEMPSPAVKIIPREDWHVSTCAYYRKETISICLEECQWPCGEAMSRNWTWPGNTVDREPYGVICHELGHHVDWLTGKERHAYSSEFSEELMKESREKPLTGYCPNPAEWFAEMFRLFVTNHYLLKAVRPKTWKLFRSRWKPVSGEDWEAEMGGNVPSRIVKAARNKIC